LQGSETVLLVEDEALVRALASRILRDRGYKVLEAADGQEALRAAKEFSGEIQLVVTDIVMPQMNGRELVSQIEANRPDTKVLYTSGYTDEAIVRHGILDPNVAFLPKPFTAADLERMVREVINR
jgi:CheY-like chemotaxis protein